MFISSEKMTKTERKKCILILNRLFPSFKHDRLCNKISSKEVCLIDFCLISRAGGGNTIEPDIRRKCFLAAWGSGIRESNS